MSSQLGWSYGCISLFEPTLRYTTLYYNTQHTIIHTRCKFSRTTTARCNVSTRNIGAVGIWSPAGIARLGTDTGGKSHPWDLGMGPGKVIDPMWILDFTTSA